MGLDLFIFARKYYGTNSAEQSQIKDLVPMGFPMTCLEVEALYMRSAWGLYSWFEKNIGEGNDEHITRKQLKQLIKDIDTAFEEQDFTAFKPPKGREDYTQYIRTELGDAKVLLTKALKYIPDTWAFYYLASW